MCQSGITLLITYDVMLVQYSGSLQYINVDYRAIPMKFTNLLPRDSRGGRDNGKIIIIIEKSLTIS